MPDHQSYKIIRQPYRITMARWRYTVIQKRVLTRIIAALQKEISLIEKGLQPGQLELFNTNSDTVTVSFLLNDLVLGSNNYAAVKKALRDLRSVDVEIVLPAVRSLKSRKPEEETILTGLIERAIIQKNARTISVSMHRSTALELVKISHGLTAFAEEVMFLTNNIHTQKIYELICHWKDRDVYTLTVDEFRSKLSLTGKYPATKDLIKWVIKPAEKELAQIGDIYFTFTTTKSHNKITTFNFSIKRRNTVSIQQPVLMAFQESIISTLRRHFYLRQEHFAQIKPVIDDVNRIPALRDKLVELWLLMKNNSPAAPKSKESTPAWTVACIKQEFMT